MFVTAFPIVNEFNGALWTFNIFKQKHLSSYSLNLCYLCVARIYCLPMQVVKGGVGMDLLIYFKIVEIVLSIKKTRGHVLPLTKA